MKKIQRFLLIALVLMLPVMGLASETEQPQQEETATTESATIGIMHDQAERGVYDQTGTPFGMMHRGHQRIDPVAPDSKESPAFSKPRKGRRQQPDSDVFPRFTDEDKDGLCDVCGKEPGTCARYRAFGDADGGRICDHFDALQPRQRDSVMKSGRRIHRPAGTSYRARRFADRFGR